MRNLAKCKRCGDIIESKSVHDFQMCSCGSIFVDGGDEYLRRGGDPEAFDEEYDALHGIEVEKPDELTKDEARGYKKALDVDRKYGSPMLKALVQMCDDEGMKNLYVNFIKSRRRAHLISLTSRVLWVLGLVSSIVSFFYAPLLIMTLTLFLFGAYLECGAMFLIGEAHHFKNAITIAAINHQVSDLTEDIERLENKRKGKNVKRPRKTQRKSA